MISAVSGTRRQIRELVDGTIEVKIQIDPQDRKAFLELFPEIDARVALAPLFSEHEIAKKEEKEQVGPLCKLAVQWCKNETFLKWLANERGIFFSIGEEEAKDIIYGMCEIETRRDLDTNWRAAAIFDKEIRLPYMNYLESKK